MMDPFSWQGVRWLSASAWAYPVLEVAHIVGIALMLGSLVLVELRVWAYAAELPLRPLARAGLRLSMTGFGVIVCSGLLMFAAHPGELLANRAFVIKIGLVLLGGVNAAAFHLRDSLGRSDTTARAQTVLSLGLWLAVIICGRWIAYL